MEAARFFLILAFILSPAGGIRISFFGIFHVCPFVSYACFSVQHTSWWFFPPVIYPILVRVKSC